MASEEQKQGWGRLDEDDDVSGIVGVEEDEDLRLLADVLLEEFSRRAAIEEGEEVTMDDLYVLMAHRFSQVDREDFEAELLLLSHKLSLPVENSLALSAEKQRELFDTLDVHHTGLVKVDDVMEALERMHVPLGRTEVESAVERAAERQARRSEKVSLLQGDEDTSAGSSGAGKGKRRRRVNETAGGPGSRGIEGAGGKREGDTIGEKKRNGKSAREGERKRGTEECSECKEVDFEEFHEVMKAVPMTTAGGLYKQLVDALSLESGSASSEMMWLSMVTPEQRRWTYFLAGGLGGLASKLCTAPLDRVKILAQTSADSAGSGTRTIVTRIFSQEGWRGFYRGNLASVIRIIPFSSVVCGVYTIILDKRPKKGKAILPNEPVLRLLAGGMAGKGQYLTMRTVLRNMVREPHTALQGLRPALWAVVPFIAVQQASYDLMKFTALSFTPPSVPLFLACGAVAGVAAQSIVYPFDLIRRRMQVQDPWTQAMARDAEVSVGRQKYRNTVHALRTIIKNEGARALYRGLLPSTMKVGPAIAMSLMVRDACLGRLTTPERPQKKLER